MSLKTYSKEELKNMPMIDIAEHILFDEKEALHFKKMFEQIAEIKGFLSSQKTELIAQFYTDLNMDGRFITLGSNLWGLKRWYPADQIDERISNPSKKKETDEDDDDLDIVDDEMDELVEEFADDEEYDEDNEYEDKDDDFEKVEKEEFPTYNDDDDDY